MEKLLIFEPEKWRKKYVRSRKVLIICLLIFNFSVENSFANYFQQEPVIVTGSVVDSDGIPIPGVTVMEKNTSNGTVTDFDGNYSIEVSSSNAQLVFSFIGMATIERTIEGDTTINIQMEDDLQSLKEVVVVGYGKQEKATLTGAVSSIESEEINTTTNANLQNMIAGKISGVRIQQRTSEPGNFDNNIDIRGFGSPLIVIDGVTSDLQTFNRLAPSNIESVSVLKDASAAVYGMKAGNGVVLVTTKKGDGEPSIAYSGTFGVSHQIGLPGTMNAFKWATLQNEAARYAFNPRPEPYSAEQLEAFKVNPGVDWYGKVVQNYAPQTTHTVSASGSAGENDAVRYFMSANYFKEEGMWKSGSLNYDRWNLRSNISAEITNSLTAEMNVGYIMDNKNAPYKSTMQIFKGLWTIKPIFNSPYANENPNYPQNTAFGFNPVVTTTDAAGYNKGNERRLMAQGVINWEAPFVEGLTARFMYNYTYNTDFSKAWGKSYQLYNYDEDTDSYEAQNYQDPTTLRQSYYEEERKIYQLSLNYETSILERHNVKALLLFEQNKFSNKSVWAQREFSMDAVDQLFAGNENNQQGSAYKPFQSANQGLIGRFNYNYNSKYLAEFSFRYDGSSKFASGYRWGFFPATSVGWRISEENFIENTRALSFVDNLKLRASYGKLGDDGSSSYQWASGYIYPYDLYIWGDQLVSGIQDRGLTNEFLSWYTSTIINIGIDWGFWNGNFNGTFEVFRRDREGLLATRIGSLPGTVGANFPQENLNSDRTEGWELELSHDNTIGNFRYGIAGNISYSRTKNIYVERAKATNSYNNWRSNPNNRWNDLWWGMDLLGQFSSEEEIQNALNEEGTFQNSFTGIGDFYHADLNGDGYVDGSDVEPRWTQGMPKVNFGFTANAEYKNFDLNLHFQGSTQSYMKYIELFAQPTAFGGGGALDFFWDRWHQDNEGDWIAGTYPRTRDSNSYGPNNRTDDFWVNDATFLRLKSAEFGYTIPQGFSSKAGIERARIYINGFNLLTFSDLNFTDPEHTSDTYGYLYPITQNYNIGLTLTF